MSESTAPAGNAADTSQEALKLVICCWKNFGADNKINFQAVANELEITSKAAACRKRATKATAGAGEGKTKRSKSVAVPVKENDEDPFVEQNAGKKDAEEETKE
ncbi:hypothetical protein HYQ46_007322 [Verticillium longisporum]|nr:hypothetical protein HYQ46_007322 [Verticillium longisporum]